MLTEIGFWTPSGHNWEDLGLFRAWSEIMTVYGTLPHDPGWQYPPGAGLFMLIPRIGGGFEVLFIILMLLLDLAILAMIWRLGRTEGRDTGVWVWLLVLPMLGELPLLRFDLVPTALAVGALLVIHRRPKLFGFLVGLGASIKVWPIFLILAEWDRSRLRAGAAVILATFAVILVGTAIAFADPLGFLGHQGGRGLQSEAVASLPWKAWEVMTGKGPALVAAYGSNEIVTGLGKAVAKLLDLAAVLVLLAAALWWRVRERRIRAGRSDLEDVVLSRDFAFATILWFVVVSRVFSPQYMIWLLGLGCLVLSSPRSRLTRGAWVTVAATVPSFVFFKQPSDATALLIRNLAILYAAIESAVVLIGVLASPAGSRAPARPGRSDPVAAVRS